MSGESLIIAWQNPREFVVRDSFIQWAKDVKKEIRNTRGKRMKWALVAEDVSSDRTEFKGKRDAAEKVFGYFHTKWDVSDNKFYVRLPWWKF